MADILNFFNFGKRKEKKVIEVSKIENIGNLKSVEDRDEGSGTEEGWGWGAHLVLFQLGRIPMLIILFKRRNLPVGKQI